MIKNLLLVGLGGGVGSMGRYLCQRWIISLFPSHYPWGTFAVNIIGCLAIGIFWGLSVKSVDATDPVVIGGRLFLMVGLCGGFTTFSAFTLEGIGLLRDNRLALFFLYMGASVLIGLFATYLGIRISR